MIIRFDHITYVANRREKKNFKYEENEFLFVEKNLKNANNKKPLMKYDQETHDLYFYNKELMPIEYIFYDETYRKNTNIKIDGCDIYACYSNKDLAINFLEKTFKKVETNSNNEIVCCVSGLLDKTKYYLHLLPEKDLEAYLDQEGFGVPTLMCNSIPKDVEEYLSDINEININGKIFDVCFLKCDYINVIFELLLVK